VTTRVDCDGVEHRITWRRGKLVLHDHRLADETVFLALGGAPPPCFVILQEWRDRRRWAAAARPHPPGFVRRVAPPRVPDPLATVRRLGVVRSWEREWRRHRRSDEAEDLYRLLRKTALPWLAATLDAARREREGGRPRFVEVRLAAPDREPTVEGRIDAHQSSLVATLPPSWLYTSGLRDHEDKAFEVTPGHEVGWQRAGETTWIAALIPI
jgi:hypothetical protein